MINMINELQPIATVNRVEAGLMWNERRRSKVDVSAFWVGEVFGREYSFVWDAFDLKLLTDESQAKQRQWVN